MTRCLTLTATVVLSLNCVPPVLAQELPSEGKFSITYTAVNPAPSKAVSIGDREVNPPRRRPASMMPAAVFCTIWPVAATS